MADIGDPAYTPSPVDITATVNSLKQVVGGLLVSNPLQNAVTTSGLMQWIGNYGQYFLWIGEFFPGDPNFTQPNGSPKPQRGFVLRRDDQQQNFAIEMYDYDPYVGGPLRQKLQIKDADGRNMLIEGESGGIAWPRLPIPMGDIGYSNSTSDQVMASGRSQVVGRHIDYLFQVRALATVTAAGVQVPAPFNGPAAGLIAHAYVQVQIGGDTITTTATTLAGGGFFSGTIDLGNDWFEKTSDFMLIDIHAWMTPSSASMLLCEPVQMHNYTQWTNRQIEGF